MEKIIEGFQKEIIDLQDTVKLYKTEVKTLEADNNLLKTELKLTDTRRHELEKECKELREDIQLLEADQFKEIDDLKEEVESLQKEAIDLQDSVSFYQNLVKSQKELCDKVKAELKCCKEIESDSFNRHKDILDKTLFELPVGNVKAHTYESIPDRVAYYIKEHSANEADFEKAIEYIDSVMPNFYGEYEATTMYDTVVKLVSMLNKSSLDEWVESEKLERLEEEIETFYEYYAGFGAKKGLTSTQMLNHILQKVPNYKPTKTESDYEVLKRHCDRFIKALDEITKKNRKADTCRMIALEALGELHDEDYQPELLIEENLKLRMELEDVQSKLADATLEKVSVMKPKPTLDDIKPPTYGGEIYCSYCKKFHWIGLDCPYNPEFQKYNWTNKEADTSCITQHPTHCQDCGKHIDYHHEEHCEAKKPKPTLDDVKPPIYMGCVEL